MDPLILRGLLRVQRWRSAVWRVGRCFRSENWLKLTDRIDRFRERSFTSAAGTLRGAFVITVELQFREWTRKGKGLLSSIAQKRKIGMRTSLKFNPQSTFTAAFVGELMETERKKIRPVLRPQQTC